MNKNCKSQCWYCHNGLTNFWVKTPDARCPYCFCMISEKMNKIQNVRGGYEKIRYGLDYQTWLNKSIEGDKV